MSSLEQFKIDLKGLTEDTTPLEYELTDGFFAALSDAEIKRGSLHVSGSIRKAVGFFELSLGISGTVSIPCDRCLEDMSQSIETQLRLRVKLGSGSFGSPDEDAPGQDEVVVVDEKDAIFDTAWPIYESIALAVPIQHVHQPGDCNVAMSEKLKELSAARSSDADARQDVDPRWEKLKSLKV